MSSLRRTAPILALVAATLTLAACGGGSKEAEATTTTRAPAVPHPSKPVVSESERTPLDPDKTYTVELKTSEGDFTIALDQKTSPKVTASFAALVRKGFFDGTIFHRIVPGFLIQGGDPTGTGTGDPGYTVVDKPKPGTKYTQGVVAMAKRGDEPAGASGSQFFIVTKDDLELPPLYAVLGRVTAGMPVVQKIGKLGDVATEQPTKRVVIDKATMTGD
ncbi:MAG TPA: peptidylprolyl isomerase [Gaiellaceae bacterium]|nr:peptidylprolyl isomerase [Gaiellaceae bacterium]